MWKGLYHHMEKSMSLPQSPADYLSAVREKSQQLEEEMTNHREVSAGGTTKHHQQLGPKQGIHDTNIHGWKQNHNPPSSCLPLRIFQVCSLEKRKAKKEPAYDPNEQSCLQFLSLESDKCHNKCKIFLFGFTSWLGPDLSCVVAFSAEDHGPDREANHLGEGPGSHWNH